MASWFVVRDGDEQGPVTAGQLKEMAAKGKLQPGDLVRREDMQAPREASTIKGLFSSDGRWSSVTSPATPASSSGDDEKGNKSGSKKMLVLLSALAGACLFLCCGGFGVIALFGSRMADAARKELAEADAVWVSGDKAGAVNKYRAILGNRANFLKEEDRPRIYGRVIDYDMESGNAESAKKLLAEAARNKVKPAVSHPEAKALLAAEEARVAREQASARGEALTPDFYPFKKGTVQHTMGTLYVGKMQVQSRKEYAHEEDGVIKVRWLKQFAVQGGANLPLPKPKQLLHREKDGFVEIGEENGVTKAVEWRPIIKAGAVAGEQWEREIGSGVKETYKLTKFGSMEVALKGGGSKEKLAVAFIEVRSTTKLPSGKALEGIEEIEVGRGVGPIYRKSWRIENGERMPNWSESIAPVPTNPTEDSSRGKTTFKVNRGALGGDITVEISPEVTGEIDISDLKLTNDLLELWFKLTLKREVNFAKHNWHHTAYDKDGATVCEGILYTRHAIKVGENISASVVFICKKKEDRQTITKVVIHR